MHICTYRQGYLEVTLQLQGLWHYIYIFIFITEISHQHQICEVSATVPEPNLHCLVPNVFMEMVSVLGSTHCAGYQNTFNNNIKTLVILANFCCEPDPV